MLYLIWLLSLISTLIFRVVQALPSWDGGWFTQPQTSIGSLVPGATFIEAITEGIDTRQYVSKYLSIPTAKGIKEYVELKEVSVPTGVSGPAVVYENRAPPVFYVHNGQLWQPTNLTSILRVNVMNVTSIDETGQAHPAPLKIELSESAKGLDGTWRWQGTKLFFNVGEHSNHGLYFLCQTTTGVRGVYTSLEEMPPPPGCKFMTLHSFADRPDRS